MKEPKETIIISTNQDFKLRIQLINQARQLLPNLQIYIWIKKVGSDAWKQAGTAQTDNARIASFSFPIPPNANKILILGHRSIPDNISVLC